MNLFKTIVRDIYKRWSKSAEYEKISAVENEIFEKYSTEIANAVGNALFNKIFYSVENLATASEYCGFENGFKYGMVFMLSMMKDGEAV